MARIDPLLRAESRIRGFLDRALTPFRIPAIPDYGFIPDGDVRELWLRRLDRVRDTLEQARTVIERDGWTSGGWFTVRAPSGGVRVAAPLEAYALRDARSRVVSACLVGTLLRLADDPDAATSVRDVWGSVDELYEAMHEQLGHASLPPGRVYSANDRRTRLQGVTAWNDAPGRTRDQVLDLLDRAVSRTIVAACN
ncbi:MAG: hypothetical protein JWN06_775 [Propionibacteriaceae bacterium]|jgi:hypothetical protein|nr:hypothetical protein [Propionibacteriaceae bacterium]